MKRRATYTFAVLLGVVLIYVAWRAVRSAVLRVTCPTETVKVEDLSGFRFEMEYTNCDTLAKDEVIRVYANRATSENQRTLLFSYDPGRPNAPLPSITLPSKSTILISIPEVSSIIYQNRIWENMMIKYDIGRVYYPHASK